MPCVHANARREWKEYVRKNRRDLNEFASVTDAVEILKIVHNPRKFDPLVNWIPYPTPTDQLYATLNSEEATRMAAYSESLIGTDRHNEAEQICLCLAAFTNANLEGCLRRLLAHGKIWPSLPFHRASVDVRDELLARIEDDSVNRNHILLALAWIGDSTVVSQFDKWRRNPPRWRTSLYVPPHDYSRQAGWELTNDGRRRELYFTKCTRLIKGSSDMPISFLASSARADVCPWCSSLLTNLFELNLTSFGVAPNSNWSAVQIATCEVCTAFGTVFGSIDENGIGHWSPNNSRPTYLPDNFQTWSKIPNDALRPDGPRPPLFAADLFLPTTFSQIGGHPTWIQNAEYPKCPDCSATMVFLAQIDRQDIDVSEGVYYAFICPGCRTTATTYQQT